MGNKVVNDELIQTIGSVASITEEVYKIACNNLTKRYHKENMKKLINDEPITGYAYSDLLEVYDLKNQHKDFFKKVIFNSKKINKNDYPEFIDAINDLKQQVSFELEMI